MGHGNNQTRSAIPQAAWCQLNRGRIRRLLGYDMQIRVPNITGEFVASAYVTVGTQKGAFRVGKITDCPNKDNDGGHLFYFDASDSDSTYGATQTVQPPSIRLVQCIKF